MLHSQINPVNTYRIQFSKDFRFKDLLKTMDYLHAMGVKTIYASPVFKAIPGSAHGYDLTDPNEINPEIGSLEELKELINKLDSFNMHWMQDIVPNHMAYSEMNPWIADILRKGNDSDYRDFFDIDWNHWRDELKNKVLLPFFGKDPGELIEDGELKLSYDSDWFVLQYYDHHYPVSYTSFSFILNCFPRRKMPEQLNRVNELFAQGKPDEGFKELRNAQSPDKPSIQFIRECVSEINSNHKMMKELLVLQVFFPAHWKESETKINYRRFFTINDLISLKMENEAVFFEYHSLIRELTDGNYFKGIRVDHVDGLYNPGKYLSKLRKLIGDDKYLTVEKILDGDEELPWEWPVQGTTGYDFSAMLNNLFTDSSNHKKFQKIYQKWDPGNPGYSKQVREKKRFIILNRMGGDLDNLWHHCMSILSDWQIEADPEKTREAIAAFLVHCPVYKFYQQIDPGNKLRKKFVSRIIRSAINDNASLKKELMLLENLFTGKGKNEREKKDADEFFYRCMQYTGPLMAKGLEDTLFYSYANFIAHNEVGDNPAVFGYGIDSFHDRMIRRLSGYPMTMNASSTHDSKRGEDLRARLLVISEIPALWKEYANRWRKLNEKFRENAEKPSLKDEYYIYQSLAGSYPLELNHDKEYSERLKSYLIKSVKEAKDNTSWTDPDVTYEKLLRRFVDKILDHEAFILSLHQFLQIIIGPGLINSLSQLLLKNTVPGIPDLYQGSERWNFNFVDPDNRRPVDFVNLENTLKGILGIEKNNEQLFRELWNEKENGNIKLWVTQKLLKERNHNPKIFIDGEYIPLKTKGKYKEHVLAYLRHLGRDWYLIVVPLHLTALKSIERDLLRKDWQKTKIKMPVLSPARWINVLDMKEYAFDRSVFVNDIFKNSMPAIFRATTQDTDRKAGILMHITSLPGNHGIGDLGPSAYEFVEFLHRTGQSYWQILPLSYIDEAGSYSPYSSLSAFAGNILFISLDILVKEGLLLAEEITNDVSSYNDKVQYKDVEAYKKLMLKKAYLHYKMNPEQATREHFQHFCKQEKEWLDDFAMFMLFRNLYPGKTWNKWPVIIRERKKEELLKAITEHADYIEETKFYQFLFYRQWHQLRSVANQKGIRMFGDMPIYVSFDSADVWANPHMFKLTASKRRKTVAGVPPDYFNDKGQLWGMPIYRWNVMRKDGYKWWMARIQKNLELFDLLRIDHFRAFLNFWEVPAKNKDAIEGKWSKGPGDDFLNVLRKNFPEMPFVAEDLGDVNQDVYDLRDRFDLPGMAVLQFAFGDDMVRSVHIPHNHHENMIVYTGTHDNNTIRGWYKVDADKRTKKRLRAYLGKKVKKKNCHLEMIRLAYASKARIAIIPIQDFIGRGEESRMNKPSTVHNNWTWRIRPDELDDPLEKNVQKLGYLYGRL